MIKFGPAGNSEAFYEQGYKSTWQAPKWLHDLGLNAFEYSFGRGVRLTQATAEKIGAEAQANQVYLSVHAPYFINLAGEGEEKFEKNLMYLEQSAQAAQNLGATRVVFHPGACAKMDRRVAFENTMESFKKILTMLEEKGYGNLIFCPETMGKINQIANLEEVAQLTNLAENVIPTIDFAHLHARTIGGIRTKQDYIEILDFLENTIGTEKTKKIHVHFSHIEYTKAGEKMHRRFEETDFGPDYVPLCELFYERKMCPTVICESNGTQALDAKQMLEAYLHAKK